MFKILCELKHTVHRHLLPPVWCCGKSSLRGRQVSPHLPLGHHLNDPRVQWLGTQDRKFCARLQRASDRWHFWPSVTEERPLGGLNEASKIQGCVRVCVLGGVVSSPWPQGLPSRSLWTTAYTRGIRIDKSSHQNRVHSTFKGQPLLSEPIILSTCQDCQEHQTDSCSADSLPMCSSQWQIKQVHESK